MLYGLPKKKTTATLDSQEANYRQFNNWSEKYASLKTYYK